MDGIGFTEKRIRHLPRLRFCNPDGLTQRRQKAEGLSVNTQQFSVWAWVER